MKKPKDMKTPLAKAMIELADKDNLPEDHHVRKFAEEFDTCVKNQKDYSTRQILGRWARARKAYTTCKGIGLMSN